MRTACAMLRKSEEAVAPVIATILMVAITVVLSAVLYAMVSDLVKPPVDDIAYVTATVGSNDKNWTVEVKDVSGGPISTSDIRILVTMADSTVGLKSTVVSDMNSDTYYSGVRFIEATAEGYINVGDTFTLDRSIYGQGTTISIVNAGETRSLWEKTI
jgi:flagellin-like protein